MLGDVTPLALTCFAPIQQASFGSSLNVDLVGGDSSFERRPYPPGQHGRARIKESEYRLQMLAAGEFLLERRISLRAQVDGESLGELIRVLGDAGVRSLVSQPPTLEELFLRHYDTGRSEKKVSA